MINNSHIRGKRILIVPLNWGLGHATRLIPVIKLCKEEGATVILGGSNRHQDFLQQETGATETVSMPCLKIFLSHSHAQVRTIILQLPLIFIYLFREHQAVQRIIRKRKIDLIISDCCFGLWSHKIPAILITHQIYIEIPPRIKLCARLINRINTWLIHRFDACWIPDIEPKNGLAGKLSHHEIHGIQKAYIGILSRFQDGIKDKPPLSKEPGKKLVIMLSGPEKQRTVLENIIKEQLINLPSHISFTVLRGLPELSDKLLPGWYNHISSMELQAILSEADYIICRSGYSTIMDLVALNKTAMLIPTTGQSEQEYLAAYLTGKGYFLSIKQNEFELISVIQQLDVMIPVPVPVELAQNDKIRYELLRCISEQE
jgi:UDP-N-acetylglucosamine:LPS N-acetylglucosamine transferase